jgi:hypothetical protein
MWAIPGPVKKKIIFSNRTLFYTVGQSFAVIEVILNI